MNDYTDLDLPMRGGEFTLPLSDIVHYAVTLGYDVDDFLHLSPKYYPIYDEAHRDALNHKIVEHFIFREIGYETKEMFAVALGRKMNEIMPYYNQMYETELAKIDPFSTMDVTADNANNQKTDTSGKTTEDQTATGSGTSDTKTSAKTRVVNSTTPQAQLSNDGDYADALTDTSSDTDQSGTSSTNSHTTTNAQTDFTTASSSGNGTSETKGYSGIASTELLTQWRTTLLNIDMNIITDLSELFMGLVDSGDRMSPTHSKGYLAW